MTTPLYNPGTNRQVPDHAILDYYNKQAYLGNRFNYTLAYTAGGTTEVAQILLQNATQVGSAFPGKAGLFVDLKRITGLTAAANNILRAYINPTVTAGAQTVGLVADSSGSLNSTYFLLNPAGGTPLFYVWYNINSAGVDPAVPGRTGIAVAGATNASAATLGAATVTAINLAAAAYFTATGTSTVTLTNTSTGVFTLASEGAAPTGFTFTLTSAGLGTSRTPQNVRPGSASASVAALYSAPAVSANGTLIEALAAPAISSYTSKEILILDPGQLMLITIQTANSAVVDAQISWNEL